MIDAYAWLCMWEPIEAPGRHTKLYPADDAHGYRFGPPPGAGVSRAIPVDGKVEETPPSWSRSPQVRFWMDEPKPSVWARIRRWLAR